MMFVNRQLDDALLRPIITVMTQDRDLIVQRLRDMFELTHDQAGTLYHQLYFKLLAPEEITEQPLNGWMA